MAEDTKKRDVTEEGPLDQMVERSAQDLGTVLGDAEVHQLAKAFREEWEKLPAETRVHAGSLLIVFDDQGYYTTIRTPGVDPLAVLSLGLKLELTKEPHAAATLTNDGLKRVGEDNRVSVGEKCDCPMCSLGAQAEPPPGSNQN